MIDFFPALDKTAKRRRPKAGVGERIRSFIADQEGIISVVATSNFIRNISVDGIDFPTAIYKFGRTPIAHEGELDPRLTFNNAGTLQMGHIWNLPSSYIPALCIGVMISPENSNESTAAPLSITFLGRAFQVNELWGAQSQIEQIICDAFGDPDLFRRVA